MSFELRYLFSCLRSCVLGCLAVLPIMGAASVAQAPAPVPEASEAASYQSAETEPGEKKKKKSGVDLGEKDAEPDCD